MSRDGKKKATVLATCCVCQKPIWSGETIVATGGSLLHLTCEKRRSSGETSAIAEAPAETCAVGT